MASLLKAGRLLAFSAVTVFSALSITATPAFAATASNNMYQYDEPGLELRYEPICSDAAMGVSYWKVTNDNQVAVDFTWNNVENNASSDEIAMVGETVFTTAFNPADPNNRTEFTDSKHDVPVSRNAQVAACNEMPITTPQCVDGSKHDNLYVVIDNNNVAGVFTKTLAPLCNDVTLYYSAYIMPANYDGNGFFGNPTATPQTLFGESTRIDLKAGYNFAVATVNLPDTCNNVQLDVYYAPEIKSVGPEGHGTQNLLSKVLPSTGACPVTPGQGGGGETPVTPPVVTPPVVTPPVTETPGKGAGTPVATTPAQPTQLADTGSDTSFPYMIALSILLATSAVALIGRKANRA